MRSAKVRQRYWARSMEGWPLFSSIRPNTTHTSLAALEAAGAVDHVITQVGYVPMNAMVRQFSNTRICATVLFRRWPERRPAAPRRRQ